MKDFVIGIIDGICISVGRIVCTFLSEAAILALFIVFYGIYPDYRIFGTMGIILVGLIWGIYIGIKVQRSDDLPDIASDIGAWVVLICFMWFLLSIIGLFYLNINLVRALFTIVAAMIKGLFRIIFFRKKAGNDLYCTEYHCVYRPKTGAICNNSRRIL